MEQVDLSRVPKPLREFIERTAGSRIKTAYLRDADNSVVVTSDSGGATKHGFLFDLDTGQPALSFVRAPLTPFGDSWRTVLAQQQASPIQVGPNQVLFVVERDRSGYVMVAIYASKEKRALYFDLSDYGSQLTEAEKYALATLSYIASYRKTIVERLIAQGLDMDGAYTALVAKGYLKRSRSGAMTLTPAGRARKSQNDVWGLSNRI